MKKTRPVHLDLLKVQFPITAIASILHRVSGVIMFVVIGLLLMLLQNSLDSSESFDSVRSLFQSDIAKILTLGIFAAFFYHLFGGLRHLVMDMGYWEEMNSGTLSAQITIALTVIVVAAMGVWLW